MFFIWLTSLMVGAPAPPAPSLAAEIDSLDSRRVTVVLRVDERRVANTSAMQIVRDSLELRLVQGDSLGPPIFADRKIDKQTVTLTPRFALTPGAKYQATAVIDNKRLVHAFRVAAVQPPPLAVSAIYPKGAVPANCLKFYIYFSEPMREGAKIFEKIRIVNELGVEVPDPWRRVELWSPDARRLTLWIHPGRLKRGVNLRQEFGPVLQPHSKYQLVIDASVRSALGAELPQDFRHPLETGEEDHKQPRPSQWQLRTPQKPDDSLEIHFTESLDHAQIQRFLSVETAMGASVAGTFQAVSDDVARFTPKTPWLKGAYQVRVNQRLEDLAGNTPQRVFDRDLRAEQTPPPNELLRPFRIDLSGALKN